MSKILGWCLAVALILAAGPAAADGGGRFELGSPAPTPEVPDAVAAEPSDIFAHADATRLPDLRAEIARLEAAVGERPEHRETLADLGRAYWALAQVTGDAAARRQATDTFVRAAELGLREGIVRYTREISELLVAEQDRAGLYEVFGSFLALPPEQDPGGHYLALVDLADGLAHLEDANAWSFFEEALDVPTGNHREALHRYAQHLLDQGEDQAALDLFEGRLSREERLRSFAPVFQRRLALERLGLDTAEAEQEIEILRARAGEAVGLRFAPRRPEGAGPLEAATAPFSHTAISDDCRNPLVAGNCTPDGFGNCFYTVAINLAEILWNEARGESVGGQDMVGWTVRDRAYQSLSCDSYPGAQGNGLGNSCRAVVPCSDPRFCDASRRYCCVMHGGTTTPGSTQFQFNDGHTSFSNLVSSGLIYEAVYVMNGWVPEPSNNFVPPGVTSCIFGCTSPFCFIGSNITSASPKGPHEFRGNNYCALAQSCKTYRKNVCGQNAVPALCSTGGNAGDNHFWNRK